MQMQRNAMIVALAMLAILMAKPRPMPEHPCQTGWLWQPKFGLK